MTNPILTIVTDIVIIATVLLTGWMCVRGKGLGGE